MYLQKRCFTGRPNSTATRATRVATAADVLQNSALGEYPQHVLGARDRQAGSRRRSSVLLGGRNKTSLFSRVTSLRIPEVWTIAGFKRKRAGSIQLGFGPSNRVSTRLQAPPPSLSCRENRASIATKIARNSRKSAISVLKPERDCPLSPNGTLWLLFLCGRAVRFQ